MLKAIYGLGFLFLSHNAAASDWLCKEEASQRRGSDILACGVATAGTESAARLKAFDSAKTEFNRVCDASSDCKDHTVVATPQRTECEALYGAYKCYRLLIFTVGNDVREQQGAAIAIYTPPEKPRPLPVNLPKELGKPYTVAEIGFETHLSFFNLEHCEYSMCLAVVENGRLKSLEGYKQ